MLGLFRSLLICLLVLALPVQVSAAATMAFCQDHQPATAGAASPHHAQAHAVPFAGQHGHDHAAAPHDDGAPVGGAADAVPGTASADGLTPSDPHKCSACAVCCAATATSSAVLKVPDPGVTPTLFRAIVATVEHFAAVGPDRPPRSPGAPSA